MSISIHINLKHSLAPHSHKCDAPGENQSLFGSNSMQNQLVNRYVHLSICLSINQSSKMKTNYYV